MENIFINSGLAFIEGLGLIVSPCILPILPLILSGSLQGSKKRPLGIICGFILLFSLATLFSQQLVRLSSIDPNTIRALAFGLLILFGIVMMSTYLTEQFAHLTRRFANVGAHSSINNPEGGFGSGLLFGALTAVIWTPCAGPILAAVIIQVAIQKTTLSSFFILVFFAFGAIIPMLLIALFGRTLMNRLGFFKKHAVLVRKILGLIIILSVGLIMYNGSSFANTFSGIQKNTSISQTTLINGLTSPYPAPDIIDITAWINSPPLTLSTLKGNVVLIDFWTYSCINCMRTLPYIKDWYAKYHDKGLVIIGVHTPEFSFEKDVNNVKAAVEKDGILYPVALDSNYGTWQNYHNQYWPAHYLIDKSGNVVYTHFGEGDYDTTENNIRFLLGLNAITIMMPSKEDFSSLFHHQTPETYLGYERQAGFSSVENTVRDAVSNYSFPKVLDENAWALQGQWMIAGEKIISNSTNAALKMHFYAQKVYVVMGASNNQTLAVKVLLNGTIISTITVKNHTLYPLLELKQPQSGTIELVTPQAGLEVYTFTFGSE